MKFTKKSYQIRLSSTYLRLISAYGAVFCRKLENIIYLETSSLQGQNVPKLPGVLR